MAVKWNRDGGVCPYVDVGPTRYYVQDIEVWENKYHYQLMARDLSIEIRKKLHPPAKIKSWYRKKWATEVFRTWFWHKYHKPAGIDFCYGSVSKALIGTHIAVFIDDTENVLQWRDLGVPVTGRFDTERDCIKEATDIISEKLREYSKSADMQIAFDGF